MTGRAWPPWNLASDSRKDIVAAPFPVCSINMGACGGTGSSGISKAATEFDPVVRVSPRRVGRGRGQVYAACSLLVARVLRNYAIKERDKMPDGSRAALCGNSGLLHVSA